MIVSFIITTFNRKELLEVLLNSLYSQNFNREVYECQIIVVVDGSTDGTLEMLQTKFSSVKIVMGNGNWWYTKSINEGLKLAVLNKSEINILLNDDVNLADNYFSILMNDWLSIGDSFCILNSLSVMKSDINVITYAGARLESRLLLRCNHLIKPFSYRDRSELSGIFEIDITYGRGLLVPTKTLEILNFFDEKFVQYGSDDDFGLRAKRIGIKSYITWNTNVFENINTTSSSATFSKSSILTFIRGYFSKYSINSIHKAWYFYMRHGLKPLLPLYILLHIVITMRKKVFLHFKNS